MNSENVWIPWNERTDLNDWVLFMDGALAAVYLIFGIGGGQHSKEEPFDTYGRFDDMWDKCFVSVFVAIFHRFARCFGDISEIEIGAIG